MPASSSAAPPPPTRDGVGASVVALPPGDWPTIADFLIQRFPAVPPATWAARIAAGKVIDERGVPVTAHRPYRPRLKVHYWRSVDAEPPLRCVPAGGEAVLFQDDQLVVVDKPHFMAVTPGGQHLHHTLLVRLKRRLGIDALQPLHRLDRETAGLLMLSADPASRGAWQALFRERRVAKTYEAIVHWPVDGSPAQPPWSPLPAQPPRPRSALPALRELPALPAPPPSFPLTRRSRIVADPAHFMSMHEVAGEPNAETAIELVERRGALARLRLRPLTGRTHQLRVHCAALGLPIVGDTLYPRLLPHGSDDPHQPLQLLATSLACTDPLTAEPRRFDSRLALAWPAGAVPVPGLPMPRRPAGTAGCRAR